MKILSLAEFLINFARGILTLAIGKLLYDETDSLWAFSLVFVLEFLFAALTQGVAGSSIDRYGSKKVLLSAVSAAVLFMTIGLLLSIDEVMPTLLVLLAVALNLTRPFIRNAVFTLIPEAVPENQLGKANSMVNVALQSGQISGMMAAGLLLQFSTSFGILMVVWIGFFSALISYIWAFSHLAQVMLPQTPKASNGQQNQSSWLDVWQHLKQHPVLVTIYLFTLIDFVAVALFNLLLAPAIKHQFDDQNIWLTILDVTFTIGAILAGIVIARKIKNLTASLLATLMTTLFGAAYFFGLNWQASPVFLLITVFSLGVFTTVSSVSWSTALQKNSATNIKGRLASLRFVINSLFVCIATLIISYLESQTYNLATAGAGFLLIICLFIALLHHLIQQKNASAFRFSSLISRSTWN